MRKLQGLVLAFMVFAFVVPAIAADSGALKSGPAGAVEIKPGQPIEIRALLSDTVVPSVSPLVQAAIEMAIKDFGSINGHPVSLETLDEMCSGEGGRATAEAVVADVQVVGVIGTLCSGAAVEASPVISAAGLSMISPSNTSPVLTSDLAGNAGPHYHQGYYRVTDNDLIEASIVAKFSYEELGLRTMVTIHDGDAYTSAISNAFATSFGALGGAVPVVAQITKGQTDLAAVLAQFDAADPEGVFVPLFPTEAMSLIQQAARFDGLQGVTVIGAAAALVTEVLALPESEGAYFMSPRSRRQHERESSDRQKRRRCADGVRGHLRRASIVPVLGARLRRRDVAPRSYQAGCGCGRRCPVHRPCGAS